jgi:hypothetical protein
MKIPSDQQRQPLLEGLKPLIGLSFNELVTHPVIEYPGLEIQRAYTFMGRRTVRNIRYLPGDGAWHGEMTLYGEAVSVRLSTAKLKAQSDPMWGRP